MLVKHTNMTQIIFIRFNYQLPGDTTIKCKMFVLHFIHDNVLFLFVSPIQQQPNHTHFQHINMRIYVVGT